MKSTFIDGLRVTDADTVDIVEMVLAGSINKMIVKEISQASGKAIGICGKDGNLIRAKKATKVKKDPNSNIEKILNLEKGLEINKIWIAFNDAVKSTFLEKNNVCHGNDEDTHEEEKHYRW